MRGPAGGWPEQTAADAVTARSTVGTVTGGLPQTAGGLRGGPGRRPCQMRGSACRPERMAGVRGGAPGANTAPRSGGPGVTPRVLQQVEATATGYGGAA